MSELKPGKRIKVLIVDDSIVIRSLLTKILSEDPELEVVGSAPDPYVAREMLVALKPDVMTLDVEMPRMDGITFLGKVMSHFPTRTIIISSLTVEGAETSLRALEVGAIDIMAKPAFDIARSLTAIRGEITARVKAVAKSKLHVARPVLTAVAPTARKPLTNKALAETTHQILAIASSTGGTEALKVLLSRMPPDIPGTVIVQHMPPVFTRTYAEVLQRFVPFEVKEAQNGDSVYPGRVLIAPGDFHMELTRSGARYLVKLNKEPSMHGVRPAADVLLKSVANAAGANSIGVILTGMGKDGAAGLLAMKEAGSFNIAQDENSCVVFGMPKEAILLGAVDLVLPLKDIADSVIRRLKKKKAAA